MLEVDGAAVRRESLRVRDDERRAVGRPSHMESLSTSLKSCCTKGATGAAASTSVIDAVGRARFQPLLPRRGCLHWLCAASDGRASPHRSRTGPVRFSMAQIVRGSIDAAAQ